MALSAEEMTTFFIPPIILNGTYSDRSFRARYSVTCVITTTSACNLSLPAGTTTIHTLCERGYEQIGDLTTYRRPSGGPDKRLNLPSGLQCDGKPHCVNSTLYTARCYSDSDLNYFCNNYSSDDDSSSGSSGGGGDSSSKGVYGPYVLYAIGGAIIVLGFGALAVEGYLSWDGRPRMRDIPVYFAGREARNIRRHLQQDVNREQREEDLIKIEANRVRREGELMDAFHQSIAARIVEEDKIKLAFETTKNEIIARRHVLTLREMDRKMQLKTIVEDSKDTQNQRIANRFMTELALKAAKRVEELKASGQHIKVIETSIIENGKVVGTQHEYLREWYAQTDADAQKLLDEVGGDLQQTHPYAPQRNNASSGSNAANTA
ncbi:hypothetical protein CcCBS67573_g07526 [Chytriomyces confervae]|uniref:Uncharacterized protein n=1 Tax=Chytriomyces confervae TaxID=246404 RepID=A0A507ESU5_9FUNG|nr:hypothetical protein CcCBS67573_g07526 [Chytriomyces confervae]